MSTSLRWSLIKSFCGDTPTTIARHSDSMGAMLALKATLTQYPETDFIHTMIRPSKWLITAKQPAPPLFAGTPAPKSIILEVQRT